MSDDEIKKIEGRAYARGYAAGNKRKKRHGLQEKQYRERRAFLDRAFLAILPVAMSTTIWEFGGTPITSTEDRVRLANIWAKEAERQRPFP